MLLYYVMLYPPILRVFSRYRKNIPKFHDYTFLSPKRSSLHQTASFKLLCARIGSRVWAVALLKNIKTNKI